MPPETRVAHREVAARSLEGLQRLPALGDRVVVVVNWPHACCAAAFAGVVFLASGVAMQGGPELVGLLARSRAGRAASPADVTAGVCALVGYFTERSVRPPRPGCRQSARPRPPRATSPAVASAPPVTRRRHDSHPQ
jgi:hypothetical protein